ncbi:hypothetical protein ACNQHI_03685, partial [Flavobacterium sp. XS2P14]
MNINYSQDFKVLHFTKLKSLKFKCIDKIFVLIFLFISSVGLSQNFQNVAVTSVSTGGGTNNALFVANSPTIPLLKFVRAQRLSGANVGNFTINGDNIVYTHGAGGTGIPANNSKIRFTFLQADAVTPVPINDFRFVINDIDGPNNEALATNCGASVRFAGTADPTRLIIDKNPPDLNATGTVAESGAAPSRVMFEFNDVSSIEFDNYANSGFLKEFDMNQNNFAILLPLYAVCLQDSDGDGKNDAIDLDDDNDGILDSVEAGGNNPNGDQDGDGLPNYLDTTNNSGQSATYSANADGSVTNYTDADGDGVPDVYESSSDSDPLPNHLDLDSDNDGCSDSNEYYNNNTSAAIGQQFGQTGGAIAPTNANGTVIAASYTGTYTNAITVGNVITGQPANQVIFSNGNAVFSVTIPFSGTIQYQWQESTNGGTVWSNITNTGIYSGTTTASLNLTGVTLTQNGYDYRVIITKSDYVCGTVVSAAADLIVNPQANVGVVKTVNNSTPNVGSNVVFTIVASNVGPNTATNVNANDILPTGYTFVSSIVTTGTYTSGSGLWAIGTLANGVSQTLTITAIVNATGNYANMATITATENDPTSGNNSSTSTPIPVAQANVGITKAVNNSTPNVGSNVVFTLIANNAGPSSATAVSVTDVLPTGYTYVSNTAPSTGTFNSGTGVWSVGNLANGGSATLTITATVNATGSYANTASIAANEADPTLGNNTSTSTPIPVPQSNVGITKTVNNATPSVGSNVIFTLTATNAGPSSATGINVTDVLPAGYTYVSNTAPSTGTFNGGSGVWSIGNVANGGSAALTITATVNSTGSYANRADITANEADPTLGNNSSTSTPIPVPQSNVGITKTVNNATPNVGSNVIFTLTANNAGPSSATGVNVTDVLPAGYTYVSNTVPSTGTFNSGTGVWSIGNLANSASATLTITATVNATGSYANTATIAANEADPTLGNNTSISTPTPIASNVGDNDNDGIPDTTDIDDDNDGILDTTEGLNAGLLTALNGSNDANGVTVNATANITCPSGNISVDSKKISFDFRWNNGVGGGFSSQTIPSATSTQSVVSIFVDGTKYMDITTPSDGGSNADNATNNGGDAIITIFNGATFTNSLPSIQGNNYINHTPYLATTGLSTIVMTIPANIASNVSYQAILKSDDYVINNFVVVASCATDTDNDGVPNYLDLDSDNDGVFDLKESGSNPNLDLDNNGIIDGSVQSNGLPTALGGTPTTPLNTDGDGIANYLDLDSDNDGCSDSNEYYNNNTSAAIGQQFGQTGGAIAPTNTNGTVIAASYSGTYTNVVTVGNVITTQPANKVTVAGGNTVFSVTIPVSGTVAYQWQESTNGGSTFTNIINSGIYSGATSASLNLTGVTSTQNGYDYRVIITKSDYVCGNIISLSADLIVTPQSNVGITKTVNNATPNVGSDIIFTLTATNAGPSSATGVNVTDVLPAGYTYVSNTAPSTGTFNSGSGVWSIGNVANGGSATLTIAATVNATGSYANRADITANEADPTLGNNTSTSTPIPVPQSNVGITKTVNNATPSVGSDVIFTLTATNAGPSSATGVNVTDVLPAGYTYVSNTAPSTGTFNSGSGVWSIGNVANGGSATLTVTATVNATGSYANRADITANEADPTLGNNTSTSTPIPVPQSNVGIIKAVNNATPNVGSNVIFTLTANNAGPSSATGVNVTDVLPAGYSYVSNTAPSTGTFNSGSGVWSIGNLANGGSATLTITATVNATGSYANRADIAANEADPTLGNNSATSTPVPVPQSNVGITKTVNNATPSVGSDVIFTLTATNAGPSSATGVNVTDVLPAGYTFVSSTTATGTYTAGTGIWSIGTLANAGSITLTITATVNATGSYANTATIAANEADPTPGNNTSTSTPSAVDVIDAVNDGPATVASATTPTVILNVTDNDTLNTIAVTGANTDVTPITTGPLSIDINGNLTLAANTASGTYLITYELCESGASPANCNTAIVTVVVQNPLLAVNDGPITVATAEVSKVVLNVTTNDTLHGDLVTDTNTNITPKTTGPLSVASNGEITLAGNTPSGTYSIIYEICEIGANPVNCKTATATVVVFNSIVANPDITGGLPGATTGSVLGNDTLSGIPPINPADVILTTTVTNAVLTLNPDGTITIAAGTAAGPQTLEYQICEIGSNPANCSTTSVTVNVFQAAVDAIVDDFTAVPYTGGNGGTTTSVLNNDTLNGVVLNPADVNLTFSGTAPTGFVLNSNGTITVPSGQVSGTYMVFYQICEAINPGNCDIANAKIRISNQINAFDDAFPPQAPSTTVVTTVGSVLANNGNGA